MTIENPIFPPEGEGAHQYFESADLKLDELEQFLADTVFEDEETLKEVLTRRYHMKSRESFEEIQIGMTREFKGVTSDTLDELGAGRPLSGMEPESVLTIRVAMKDDKKAHLEIFKVFNRNLEYRFEYVLKSSQ